MPDSMAPDTGVRAPMPETWDEMVDVVIVGCGFAGAVAAVTAHDAGASVALLEKTGEPGGISVCSAGGLRVADDAGQAAAYLEATNAGTTPNDVLHRLAAGMVALPDRVAALAAGTSARLSRRAATGNYPFPGHDTFGFVYVDAIDGFDPVAAYPHVRGAPEGARLFQMLERGLAARGLSPRLDSPVRRLVIGPDGMVAGVWAETAAGWRSIGARGGVVLACGGFEGAADLQAQYWQMQPVLSAAFRGNTGDGIRLAQEAGAALWHLWHFHGSYGFRHADPAYPFGIRTKRVPDWLPGVGPPPEVKMPWILLDKAGRRFMNEYEPYLQDTGARPLERYSPDAQSFAALPAWLIADEAGRQLYPFGRPTWHEPGIGYEWSPDNRTEIANGILGQADSLDALAMAAGIAPDRLEATITRWNRACAAGHDADWGRPAASMMPLDQPPFVFAPVWPIVSNTQGGPAHDAEQRVLHSFGAPIPGLYAAGECGSVFGHLYLSGGNIAECFIGGEIAGRNAAARAAARAFQQHAHPQP